MDTNIVDFATNSFEFIALSRKAKVQPVASSTGGGSSFISDNEDYIHQSLNVWKRRVSSSIIMDLYIYYPKTNKHILLERWNISHQTQSSSSKKESERTNIKAIDRRIQTLLRSLQCFVRLLPGFYLIQLSNKLPLLSYHIYSPDMNNSPASTFPADSKKYKFPDIVTSKGVLEVSLDFLNSTTVKVCCHPFLSVL
jgi:hypothetical protein